MARVAVIQTAFPGDVILCTPVFESLHSAGHEVIAVVRPQAVRLIEHNPHIEKIIPYDKSKGIVEFFRAVYSLRQAQCEISLSIQRYLKSVLLPIYAGIGHRVGFDIAQVSSLYTHDIAYDRDKHEVERCLMLCAGISPTTGFTPKVVITDDEISQVNEILFVNQLNGNNFVIMAPGSVWATKRWRGYRELAWMFKNQLNYQVVLLGSEQDYNICREIASGGLAINLARQTNILQSAAIIKQAKLAITNDSAPAHIAAAVGTPVITIFGPTVPEFGFTPYAKDSVIIENKDLYCRPCSKHGPKTCPEKHFRCMTEITPAQVFRVCEKYLAKVDVSA